jgi:CHRD domain-containing protein
MRSILFLLIVICILIFSGLIYSNTTVKALQVDRYWSVLEGNQLTPPTITYAHGFIGLKFREDFKQLVYNVNVNNIDNITGIYVYSRGDNTKNASMLLNLLEEAKEVKVKEKFKEASLMLAKKNEIEGTAAIGGVTSDDLQGELKGKSLEDLHKLMLNGGIFVIVVTKEFPRGEIGGGEFVPIDRFFPDISDFDWN